ncbi:hypothetical protein CFIMG_001071RA [Ceratocystis fimbriata CBS 114723]|uniref:Ubiquitin-conjugating enzyme E2-binding protein n=1 Tax=Ceratocystis fimbriata CBS 114723 TaxID=1035309 RepID=A0A2C5X2V8_9PEZI|nr:hypothetical protein CFIMG_001071RA [Ceratocystis fimbriata CBS 114723]
MAASLPSQSQPDSLAIYAELLATLRQISVHIRLPTPADSSTRISLTDGGQRLRVQHGDHTHSLALPAPASAQSPILLPLTAATLSATRLSASWKLPLAHEVAVPHYVHEHQDVPWEARDLQPDAAVRCRACEAVLVSADTVKIWKDLPSENWAEMMEFWHCHKPHVPPQSAGVGVGLGFDKSGDSQKSQDERLAQRAYGANATIAAQKGVGFVDLTSFLFVESDVQTIKFSHSLPSIAPDPLSFTRPPPTPVICGQCGCRIGSHDAHLASIALFKWQVTTTSAVQPPSSNTCLAGSILAAMSRSGYAKSILLPTPRVISSKAENTPLPIPGPGQDTDRLLCLWIMNPNTTYSSSEAGEAVSAIRLMFKTVSKAEADKLLDSVSSDAQEVIWPREAIEDAVRALEKGFSLLPGEARQFQDWKVSLLDKWRRPAQTE